MLVLDLVDCLVLKRLAVDGQLVVTTSQLAIIFGLFEPAMTLEEVFKFVINIECLVLKSLLVKVDAAFAFVVDVGLQLLVTSFVRVFDVAAIGVVVLKLVNLVQVQAKAGMRSRND